MKTIIENGHIFFDGKFQELDKMVIEKGKITEISIISSKNKKSNSNSLSSKGKKEGSFT